jgi:asparagine synthase (glutamine-hydrolysing)
VSRENFSFEFKLKRFLRGVRCRPEIRDQIWLGSFTPAEQRSLLNGASPEIDDYEDVVRAERNCGAENLLERLMYLYSKFYLQDDILTKVDRASMACSLEARAPFLDYTFVEFVTSIPPNLKLKGLKTKHILKRAMRDKLPPDILARRKKGFGIPVAQWLRTELKPMALDIFSEERIRQQGIFDYRAISRLLDEHLRGRKDHRKQLWTLLMFQSWFGEYMEQ